jgi:hypothetical protein
VRATANWSSELARKVDATQKTAEVSGKSNDHYGQEFQRRVVWRKRGAWGSTPPKMNPANHTDQKTGGNSHCQVEQQQSLQFLPRELPLPGRDAGCERRQHKSGCGDYVETGCCLERGPLRGVFRPARREIESDSRQKKRNRKVDQDNMLCMFREQDRLGIKGIHEATYSTTTLPVIFG